MCRDCRHVHPNIIFAGATMPAKAKPFNAALESDPSWHLVFSGAPVIGKRYSHCVASDCCFAPLVWTIGNLSSCSCRYC
jgi:hypothetical protein